MKKILILSAAFAVISATSCGGGPDFDENNIRASFAVLSDTHVDGPDTPTAGKFVSALEQLRDKASEQDPNGLSAVLIAGDLVNNPYSSEDNYVQVNYFKKLYESVLNPVRTPLVYTPGNHDVFKEWTPDAIEQAKNISDRLGLDYFLTDKDEEARVKMECRHCRVEDVDILCILPVGRKPVVYTDAQLEWLDSKLSALTCRHPGRFVFILTHPMITGTVYGSELGDYWATEALTPILSKYPQAVVFGGHLHFPLNDPRSIWQGSFTAMGCGSVRYMAIEDGGYEHMAGKTVMKDCNAFSQGLLLQLDRKGSMRVTRMDFQNRSTIGEPWIVRHPDRKLEFLKKYSFEKRAASNSAPKLKSLSLTKGSPKKGGKVPVSATFTSGTDDEFVHHYVITVCNEAADTVCTKKILADFYTVPEPFLMKVEWNEFLADLPSGHYSVSLYGCDSWGAQSDTLTERLDIE